MPRPQKSDQLLLEEAKVELAAAGKSPKGLKFVEETNPVCRLCGSTTAQVIGAALEAATKSMLRRYRCRSCGSSWLAGRGAHMRYPPYVIQLAVVLMKEDWTNRDIMDHIQKVYGFRISNGLPSQWMRKFGDKFGGRYHRPHGPRRKPPQKPKPRMGGIIRSLRSVNRELVRLSKQTARIEEVVRKTKKQLQS